MSTFHTAFLIPWIDLDLGFIPPCPLNLEGSHAAAARPDLVPPEQRGAGGKLGFSTSNIADVVYRNWSVYSWDAFGSATASFEAVGTTNQAGILAPGYFASFENFTSFMTVNFPGGSHFPTKVQPDFSFPSPPRKMISWENTNDDGFYQEFYSVFDGTYVLYEHPESGQVAGYYIVMRARIYGVLEPFMWSADGGYWAEQDIRVLISVSASPFPEPAGIPAGWQVIEGGLGVFNTGSDIASRRSHPGQSTVGSADIIDITGSGRPPNWGSVSFFGNGLSSANITLRPRSIFLPHPGYS